MCEYKEHLFVYLGLLSCSLQDYASSQRSQPRLTDCRAPCNGIQNGCSGPRGTDWTRFPPMRVAYAWPTSVTSWVTRGAAIVEGLEVLLLGAGLLDDDDCDRLHS